MSCLATVAASKWPRHLWLSSLREFRVFRPYNTSYQPICSYYICFGIGFQGVPWLYPTEINSLSMRTKGAALGTASNWAFNYMGKTSITTYLYYTTVLHDTM